MAVTTTALDLLRARIAGIARALAPTAVVREVFDKDGRRILAEGNARDRRAGIDGATGRAYPPVAPSTAKAKARRGVAGKPPLLAERERIITDYRVTTDATPTEARLSWGWPSLPWVRYHRTGTRRMPRRDPSAPSPQTLNSLRSALRKYLQGVFTRG